MKEYFGLGDAIFLLGLTFMMSFDWYVIHLVVGTFFTIVVWLLVLLLIKPTKKSVPFVSTIGIFFLTTELGRYLMDWPGLYQKNWLINWIAQI
ncbi:hypothetical protein [Halocola ammonii]